MNIKSSFIRKRNNNYNVYIEYIDENGKIKQKSQGRYKNKKDAEKHLIDLKSSINNNKYIIPKDITLVDRCYKYIEDNTEDWSPYTISVRNSHMKNNISPFFKDTLLSEVTVYQVQKFANDLYKKFSPSSARVRYGFLRAVISESYRLREITENPCNFVKLPSKQDTFEANVYTKEEVKELIEKINGDIVEIPVLLMLLLGLRSGEATGLRWSDIDFENNIININQVLVNVGSEIIFKEPKTQKSERSLHSPEYLMSKLKQEKNKQNKLKLQGVLENKYNLVCLNSRLDPFKKTTLFTNFNKFLEKNNIRKIRIHDLRHTNATIMLLSGTNIKVVSERLGHSDIKISMNRYSHVLEEMDKEASKNLTNILFGN